MKNLFKISFLALSGLVSSPVLNTASAQSDQLGSGYYVVVASFKEGQDKSVQKFVDKINQGGLHASSGLDATRKLIYVYVSQYADFNESIREMEKTRSSGFADAWVRIIKGSFEAVVVTKPVEKKVEEKVEEKPSATVYVAIPKSAVDAAVNEAAGIIENPKADPVLLPQTLANTPIFMSLFNERSGKLVDGEIEVFDTERSRSMAKVKANSYLSLPDPKSKSGDLTLVCNAFGFRKTEHQINFKSTEKDTLRPYVDLVGNFYLIKFDLVRYHKGDVSPLNGVTFYTDAAIMLPESKGELNNLLVMMQDDPNYKIMLHGHTNGNSRGDVITMGPSKNFFALTNDVVKGTGTAKELSEQRAQVIKDWLVSQGIAADRMEIKGWGGSKMIHDKESVNAKKNVRVEVEILAE